MNKTIFAIGITILFICMSFNSISGIQIENKPINPSIRGNTLYVGGSGPGNYSKIQDAIGNASNGDTVFVYNDSSPYHEWNIQINKSINLIGEDRYSTIIDGNKKTYDVIFITANWVNISGFTIQKSGGLEAGISILPYIKNIAIIENEIISNSYEAGIILGRYSTNCSIIDNNVSGNIRVGIDIDFCSCNNTISGNKINSNGVYGIIIDTGANNNSICDNTISENKKGIEIWGNSINNIITNNNILSNEESGIQSMGYIKFNNITNNNIINNYNGILMDFDRYNTISNNNILNNAYGIILQNKAYKNNITGNLIYANSEQGIFFHKSNNNTIKDNIISNNNLGFCIKYTLSNNNIFYHNNFINNNLDNANDKSNNTWDNDYPSGGNYWDDYNGTDNDGDGIGDTSYFIPGGDNEDRYPLMYPSVNIPPTAPIITGPKIGKPKVEYEYTFVSTDPNDDSVWYFIDWGDNSWELTSYYDSGEEITLKHTFNKGNFTIKAKAFDINGGESDWSEFTVTMPRDKTISTSPLLKFLERYPLLNRLLNFLIK